MSVPFPSLPIPWWERRPGAFFLPSKHAFSSLPWQDWDTIERWEAVPSWDKLTVMIPRKPQEGPRADSARRAPSVLSRSPVGGDTAGQKKEGESFCQARLVPVTTVW